MNTLKRGYTLTYKDDKVLKSVRKINKKDNLKVKFYDGNLLVEVIEKEEHDG